MSDSNKNGHLLCWRCGRFDTIVSMEPVQEVVDRHFPDVILAGPLVCLACGMTGIREDFLFAIRLPLHSICDWDCPLCGAENAGEDRRCHCCSAPRISPN